MTEEAVGFLEQHFNFDWAALHKHRNRFSGQQQGEVLYLVAWRGDMPLGHVLLQWPGAPAEPAAPQLPDCPNLEDLFVHPEYRSRGIGTRLLQVAEVLAKERGFRRVGLAGTVGNLLALALYERLGYMDAGLSQFHITWPYVDRNGRQRTAEETDVYLVKNL